jgi:hypothetical protein
VIDLENKSACIFGLPDGGKSTLANYIGAAYGSRCFVFDTLNEFPPEPFDSYSPKRPGDLAEFDRVLRAVISNRQYKLIIIDEANRYCPSKPQPLPQVVADLNDWRAHWGLAVIWIARLPVQLNQDLTQMAHYLFIFRLPGKQSIQYLNDVAAGLGDTVSRLPKYHFILADGERRYSLVAPVNPKYATAKKSQPPGLTKT